jgi:TolB protein
MKRNITAVITAILLAGGISQALADEGPIIIAGSATHTVPISITGFSGEVESVLKFDLSVLGMEITTPDLAEYLVSGDDNGRVEGRLTPKGASRPLWLRAYAGGTPRTQAHAFADDIAREIRQTVPIFQTKIAFRQQLGPATEICVADFDGGNAVPVTHDGSLIGGPCWIPGGRGLLYPSWKSGDTQILEHDLSTGARRLVAGYPGANLSPEVSPNGQKVAMILSKGGSPNLYVGDLGGGGLLQLTRTREEDSCPCWSPDSQEICFVCRSGRARLQKISVNGGPARSLPVAGVFGNMTAPDWSPDGKQIAFTSGSGYFTIWVVPAGGGVAQKLVEGEDPCWAPNSRTIIFSRRINNKHVLCLLDAPTKHVKYLRQISGSCSEPSWAR